MDKLSRVISIMIDLINKPVVDTGYLSNKYSVSTRTIYRDIELLDLSGIPIVSERGKKGGFSILEGFKIDKNILTESEFSILLRGLQTLINNKDSEALGLYDKLLSILEISKKQKIIKKSNSVVIDISPFEMQKEVYLYYKDLHEAIEKKNCVRIKYFSFNGGETSRIIEPLTLLFKSSTWYLYAYCREKKSLRCFKLLRIQDLEVLDETFEERNIDVGEFNDFFTDTEEIDIVLKTNEEFSRYLQEYHYVVNIEKHKQDVFITIRYPLNNWVYATLLSFGDKAAIISPKEVKDTVVHSIKKMNNLYM